MLLTTSRRRQRTTKRDSRKRVVCTPNTVTCGSKLCIEKSGASCRRKEFTDVALSSMGVGSCPIRAFCSSSFAIDVEEMIAYSKRRQYFKDYFAKNRERVHATHVAWVRDNKDRIREYQKAWYIENRERVNARKRAYKKRNPDKVRAWRKHASPERQQRVRSLNRGYRAKLSDPYIKGELRRLIPAGIPIPASLIEAKRLHLQVVRQIKESLHLVVRQLKERHGQIRET